MRDLPDDVYRKLKERARTDRRSLAQETIYLLRKAIATDGDNKARRRQILEEIARMRPANLPNSGSSEQLLREERDR